MSNVSVGLMETAREIAVKIETVAPSEWAAVRVALLASVLYEALKCERARAESVEVSFLLDGAIERCRRTADKPERMRDEIREVIAFLLGRFDARPAPQLLRPFRVIQGGLAAQNR